MCLCDMDILKTITIIYLLIHHLFRLQWFHSPTTATRLSSPLLPARSSLTLRKGGRPVSKYRLRDAIGQNGTGLNRMDRIELHLKGCDKIG